MQVELLSLFDTGNLHLAFIGSLISAGANLIGGLFGSNNEDENRFASEVAQNKNIAFARETNEQNIAASERINAATLADKELDRALQKEFAQSGIRWRLADAKAAGVHPLYALGGAGATYSPSAISLDVPRAQAPQVEAYRSRDTLGPALAAAGQDVGRAMMATYTQGQRDEAFEQSVRDVTLQNYTLRNELLMSQIAKLKANPNPPFPMVPEDDKPEPRPQLRSHLGKWNTDPTVSNAESFETRYGELSDWIMGPYIAYRDFVANTGGLAANAERFRSALEKAYGNKPARILRRPPGRGGGW